jgi:translation initiation factor 2B subunit (eIF-2B alpha/beta/delta family)
MNSVFSFMSGNEEDKQRELLRKHLLGATYLKKLNCIIRAVTNEWESHIPPFPYTLHDLTHIQGVEDQIYNLFHFEVDRGNRVIKSANYKASPMSEKEWFLLLASVWLHDIGMIPDLDIEHDINDQKPRDIQWRSKEGMITWNRHIRDFHSQYSGKYIRKFYRLLCLDTDERDKIVEIVTHHRYKDYTKIHQLQWPGRASKPRIPLLIAYLRLADNLQIPLARNPQFRFYMAMGLDAGERFHWFKSIFAKDVECQPEKYKIIITLKRPHDMKPDELQPLMDAIQTNAQNELDSVKDILARGIFPYFLKIECVSEVEPGLEDIEKQELRECLSNLHLFNPALTPNAGSVAETVIGQLKYYLENRDLSHHVGTFYFEDYLKNILKDMKEKRPCHVALHTIYNRICNILNENGSDAEKVQKIEDFIKEFHAAKENAISEIPKIAYGRISDGFPILLYGYSTTIVHCLEYYLKEKKENIELFICEGRSKTSYRHNNRLEHCDFITYARDLKAAEKKVRDELKVRPNDPPKFKINYVTDSCAAYLFQCHKVSKVLVGANGIGLSGDVAHSLGHLTIADTAYCHKIPLYVIADGTKIDKQTDKLIESDYKCGPPGCAHPRFRENQWLTTDIDFEPELSKFHNFNPRGDFIPAERITEIITEDGMFIPTKFKEHYKKKGGQSDPCEMR